MSVFVDRRGAIPAPSSLYNWSQLSVRDRAQITEWTSLKTSHVPLVLQLLKPSLRQHFTRLRESNELKFQKLRQSAEKKKVDHPKPHFVQQSHWSQSLVRDDSNSNLDPFREDIPIRQKLPFAVSTAADAIPLYDATVSKTALQPFLEDKALDSDLLRHVLIHKGYPLWLIESLLKSRSRETLSTRMQQLHVEHNRKVAPVVVSSGVPVTRPAPTEDLSKNGIEKAKKVAKVGYTRNISKGLKVNPLYWRIPLKVDAGFVAKPSANNYSTAKFRAWVDGAAWQLSLGIKRKTQFVTASDMVKSLYKGTYKGTKPMLAELLSKSVLMLAEYKPEPIESSYTRVIVLNSHIVDDILRVKRVFELNIAGHVVSGLDQMPAFLPLMRRHMPIYRACVQYLAGVDFNARQMGELFRSLELIKPKFVGKYDTDDSSTGGLEVESLVSPGEDLGGQIAQIICSLAGMIESDKTSLIRPLTQIGAFLTGVSSSSSWASVFAHCVQFVAANDFLWKVFSKMVSRMSFPHYLFVGSDFFSKPFMQVFPTLQMTWDFIMMSVSGIVSMLLSESLGNVAAFYPSCLSIMWEARTFLVKDVGQSLAKAMLFCVSEVISRVKRCVEQKSLSPLWGESWDPKRWCRSVESMISYFPILTGTGDGGSDLKSLREKGLIPIWWTGPMQLHAFVDLCETYHSQGKQLCSHFSRYPELTREIVSVNNRLRVFLDNIRTSLHSSSERLAPFMIMLQGPPGAGKSVLAKLMARAIGNLNSYDVSSAGIYDWQEGVNFQDGLSHVQWCVSMDDVDQGVASDQAGVRNYVQNVIALVNNVPFPVESAAVEMKGKIFANPRLVTYCTNFPNASLQGRTKEPHAFWRRVGLYVEVKALPEFSSGNGCLDKNKIADHDNYELYDLTVRDYQSSAAHRADPYAIPFGNARSVTLSQLFEIMHGRFREHILNQETQMKMRMGKLPYCTVCGLPIGTRQCEHAFSEQAVVVGNAFKRARKFTVRYFGKALADVERIMEQVVTPILVIFAINLPFLIGTYYAVKLLMSCFSGREANATGLVPKDWMRVDQTYVPGIPPSSVGVTYTKEDLQQTLMSCFVDVKGSAAAGSGVILGQNTILFPTHFVGKGRPTFNQDIDFGSMITIRCESRAIELQINPLNCVKLPCNPELCVLRTGELKGIPGLLAKIWMTDDQSISSFDEVEVWSPGGLVWKGTDNSRVVLAESVGWRLPFESVPGMCGDVFVARHGTSWKVIAMLYVTLAQSTVGGVITQLDLKRVISSLGAVFVGVETCVSQMSRVPSEVVFSKYPVKSEVWVAMTAGAQVYPVGEIFPPMAGSTMKTKIVKSICYDDFVPLEEEFCASSPYWTFPDFRGKMDQEKHVWVSPFTEAFVKNRVSSPNIKAMWLALADFIRDVNTLDVSGWAELSENQVIVGVPGSYVHSMNLQTSVGPPFNCSKRNHIAVINREGYASPEVLHMFDELSQLLTFAVPAAFGLCTLKDEPVKPGKRPRVFTCLSASFNMLLKKHMGAVKSFMRANAAYFESAVGVDMTGPDVARIILALSSVDASLSRLVETDAAKLDKSYTGEMFDFVALAFYAIAWNIGCDAHKVLRLILGLKHTRYCIKGDVFSTWWNPSGHDATVEVNGVCMSIGHRYAYYLPKVQFYSDVQVCAFMMGFFDKPVPAIDGLDFRLYNALWTYGDDVLRALSPKLPFIDDTAIWLTDLGIQLTDADKSGLVSLKTISQVQFLKRHFVWSPVYKRYLTPLDPKSLVRTLLFKKESILSSRDHACVSMSEVLRECVYHGEEFYNRFLTIFRGVVRKYELSDNAYLRLFAYDYWHEQLLAGTFVAWVPREKGPIPHMSIENDYTRDR